MSCPPRRPRGPTRRGCHPADVSWTAAVEPCPAAHEAFCCRLFPLQNAASCHRQRSLSRHDVGREAQRTRRHRRRCPACELWVACERQRRDKAGVAHSRLTGCRCCCVSRSSYDRGAGGLQRCCPGGCPQGRFEAGRARWSALSTRASDSDYGCLVLSSPLFPYSLT